MRHYGIAKFYLNLLAILDFLVENAVLITDTVAVRGQAKRGHGVEETGGQTTQTAVAQSSVVLQLQISKTT